MADLVVVEVKIIADLLLAVLALLDKEIMVVLEEILLAAVVVALVLLAQTLQ
jgi:hypothetical protein